MRPAGRSARDQYLSCVLLERNVLGVHNVLGVDVRRSGPANWWRGARLRGARVRGARVRGARVRGVPWHAHSNKRSRACTRGQPTRLSVLLSPPLH